MKKTVLIPLPSKDFDPTEVAIPWKILSGNNIQILFATSDGHIARADDRILNGTGLGLLALTLKANVNAQTAYAEMATFKEFLNPIKWSDINANCRHHHHRTSRITAFAANCSL